MRVRNLKNQAGFTIIELVIVGGIITILAAVSIPAIRSFNESTGLRAEAKQMASDLWLARQKAISTSTPYSVLFESAENAYTVFVDDGAGNADNAANGIHDIGEEVITVNAMSDDIMLYDIYLDPQDAVIFTPRGMLKFGTTGGHICLANDDFQHHTIYVRPSGLTKSAAGYPECH